MECDSEGGGRRACVIDALSKRHATAAPSLRVRRGRRLDDDAGAAPAGRARSAELLLGQTAPFGVQGPTSATAGARKQHTTAPRIFEESPTIYSRPTLRDSVKNAFLMRIGRFEQG